VAGLLLQMGGQANRTDCNAATLQRICLRVSRRHPHLLGGDQVDSRFASLPLYRQEDTCVRRRWLAAPALLVVPHPFWIR